MKRIFSFLIFFILLVSFVLAQENGIEAIKQEVLKILGNIINFSFTLFMIVGGFALLFLGVKYILAKGDIKELHKSLYYVILGIVLLVSSFFIPSLLKNFLESLTR